MLLLELLYAALGEQIGICVVTNSPEKLRQKLYAVRKENAEFMGLSFLISPTAPQEHLWIVKRTPDAPSE